jgi:2-polyprenyl-6-methoxyphenol hydroxylase-like FAD-dependent oxidoreductase
LQTRISSTNDIYPRAEKQIGRGSYFAVTGGKTIFAQRQGDGSYNIYAGLRLPKDWNNENGDILASREARERFIREEYADWDSTLTDLILHSDSGRYHRWPIHSLTAEESHWTHVPGLTLIGDAAHVAFVNGEGVNIGMFDSLQLVRQIVRCGLDRLDEAVVAYETEMFVRGKENIEDGVEKENFLYGEDAPREFIKWLRAVGM